MNAWRIVEARRRDGGRFPVAIWLISRWIDERARTAIFLRDMSEMVKRLGETGRQLRKQAGTLEPDLKAS